MGLDRVALRQVLTVAKNSDKLKKSLADMENKVIDEGLGLIEKAGIDPNTLPIDVRSVLRGEAPTVDTSKLLTPEVICSQPLMTVQQKEEVTRLITSAQEKITNIYATTNSIKETVLSLQEPVVALQEKVNPVNTTINTIDDIITIIKILALPTSFPPGAGVPLSVPNTFASTLITMGELVEKAKASVGLIPTATSTLVNLLNSVTTPLNKINFVIDPFLNILGMVKAITELQDFCPLLTQADIDANKASLMSNIKGQLSTIDTAFSIGLGNVLEDRLTPNASNPYYYKNFKFILENDPVQEFSFPSRRMKMIRTNAIGVNDGIDGSGSPIIVYNNNLTTNPELEEGAYTYTSNVNVLVAEGKFAIDVYTNNIRIWIPPPVRDRVSGSSSTNVDLTDPAAIEAFISLYGYPPTGGFGSDPLPTFIRYGSRTVSLNSSATDVEYGISKLIKQNSYAQGEELTISSYIASGTIQVNKPVNIRMKTFGGSGVPNSQTGFTNALLTIRRSFSIQDNVNPYTGKIVGFQQSKVDDYIELYGNNRLSTLISLNEMFQGTTIPLSDFNNTDTREDIIGLNYLERLKYVKNEYFGPTGQRRGNDNPQLRPGGLNSLIYALFDKTTKIFWNHDLLDWSTRIYGDRYNIDDREQNWEQTNEYVQKKLVNGLTLAGVNWFYAAWVNSREEQIGVESQGWKKAATLSMFYEFGKQVTEDYNEIFNQQSSPGYNNGAWVGGATSIPIIPTQVDTSNEDIVISLQASQIVYKEDTLNEVVGTLELLGTYTYDLEIIDSIPLEGGAEENFPTNYTTFKIENT
mgnify:CR=1 FL=1